MNDTDSIDISTAQNMGDVHGDARQTRPNIRVDAQERWWYAETQIINPDVLAYFKLNLRCDDAGRYFIINRFGELLEHGMLDAVAGFPLTIETILPGTQADGHAEPTLELRLDSREALTAPASALTRFDEETLGLRLPERGVPARLGPMAMASLVSLLVETEAGDGQPDQSGFALDFTEYKCQVPIAAATRADWFGPDSGAVLLNPLD